MARLTFFARIQELQVGCPGDLSRLKMADVFAIILRLLGFAQRCLVWCRWLVASLTQCILADLGSLCSFHCFRGARGGLSLGTDLDSALPTGPCMLMTKPLFCSKIALHRGELAHSNGDCVGARSAAESGTHRAAGQHGALRGLGTRHVRQCLAVCDHAVLGPLSHVSGSFSSTGNLAS